MFDTIAGLPLHPLVVHATEVLVPTAALVVALAALWPPFRRWARFLTPALALAALILVPVSAQTGERLRERTGDSPLIQAHADIAEGLLPWVIVLFVVAAALLWWNWNEPKASPSRAPKWVALVLAVTAVVVATGTIVQAIRIGHSGATAVWSHYVTASASQSAAEEPDYGLPGLPGLPRLPG